MEFTYKGAKFITSAPYEIGDGRYCCMIYLVTPFRKNIGEKVKARSEDELKQKINEKAAKLYSDNKIKLMDWITSGELIKVSLELYYYLRKEDIEQRNNWARKKDEYKKIAEEILLEKFGAICLRGSDGTNPLTKDNLVDKMEEIFHRQAKKERYSEKEKKCWRLLDAIIKEAINVDQLLENNPIKEIIKKCNRNWGQAGQKALSRQNLTEEELSEFLLLALQKQKGADRYAAAIISAMEVLCPGEVCGLNLGDFKKWNSVCYLEIAKSYDQKRGEEPKMTGLLEDGNKYRRVVCTDVMMTYIAQQILRRTLEGATETDPLFVEGGNRLTPDQFKATVKELTGAVIWEGVRHGLCKRGKKFGSGDKRDVFFGDILRNTGEYYLRTYCKMLDDESAAVRGDSKDHTYGEYYADWMNEQIMMQEKACMENWHRDFLKILPDGSLGVRRDSRGICERYVMIIRAKVGSKITVDVPYGADGSVQSLKKSEG